MNRAARRMAARPPRGYAPPPGMKPPPPRPPPAAPLRRALGVALTSVWCALVVLAPLVAAWVASSLAAHAGWRVGAAAASGLLVFPVLPVAWELVASWRASRRPARGRAWLSRGDRVVLRTLAVSVAFVGTLLALDPQRAFVALNSRGDWMLDGRRDPRAESVRRGLFSSAARLQWLVQRARDEAQRPVARPLPAGVARVLPTRVDNPVQPAPRPSPARDPHAWPWDDALHPAVASLPASAETSPEAVGRYLAAAEADPLRRARAVHDYVADRVVYDVEAYRAGVYPPQDALTTFRTRRSVCAGYAALFEAIGRAAGLTVETVTGRARGLVHAGMGEAHAWSAVRLDGRWHLVDTTWDAGHVDAEGFHKQFGARYFLAPPEVFGTKHFPDDARWQLLPVARTEGEYLRTPALDPRFFAHGLRLVSPDRAESDARAALAVVVDNPQGASLMVSVRPDGGASLACDVEGVARVTARCPLAGDGLHEVTLFVARERYTTHWSAGVLRVHNR